MKADKSGTWNEQQRYEVNWKSGRNNNSQSKRCDGCYFFKKDTTSCAGFEAKTQKTAVCDSFIKRRGA